MKRLFKLIPIVLVVIGISIFGLKWWNDSKKEATGNAIHLYGTIEIRDARLAFNEQERIEVVLVEEGDRVSAGQILARLQNQRLLARIEESKSNLAARQETLNRLLAGTRKLEIEQVRAQRDAARVRLANARRSHARILKTTGAGASSEQALDDAEAAVDVATAEHTIREKALQLAIEGPRPEEIGEARNLVAAAQSSLDWLQLRLADTVLKAPAAGVVRSRILEPGEMADPSRPVLSLALSDPKWVRAYVPEPQLGHIRPGMPAQVISDSFDAQGFEGWIGFISPEAEFTPKNVETTELRTKLVYEVRVYVRDPHDRLRLGMPVSVIVDPTGKLPVSQRAGQ